MAFEAHYWRELGGGVLLRVDSSEKNATRSEEKRRCGGTGTGLSGIQVKFKLDEHDCTTGWPPLSPPPPTSTSSEIGQNEGPAI